MKKILTVIGAVAILALSGCAASEGETVGTYAPQSHYVFQQEVESGRFVTCVWAKNGYGGGLSCDWVGYHAGEVSE